MRTGVVIEFDEARGLGALADDEGATTPFQCLAIADGSRSIAVGARVSFDLIPTIGRYEAWNIRPRA